MTPFKNILVPIDYSEPADAALRIAAHLARTAGGSLRVVHALTPVYAIAELPILPVDGQWIDEERRRLEQHVRQQLEPHGEIPAFTAEVILDTPFLGIVRVAAELNVDLIVMGTHGRAGLKHLVLGSVAERVVRFAPCPVLTVHGDVSARAATTDAATRQVVVTRPGEVAELMHRNPITIEVGATLAEARSLFASHGIRHLPVVQSGKLVGILSDADLGPHVGYFANTKVNVAMTPNPTTIAPDANVAVAARLMLEHKVRALPVIDGDSIVGVVSVSDVLEEYIRAARR